MIQRKQVDILLHIMSQFIYKGRYDFGVHYEYFSYIYILKQRSEFDHEGSTVVSNVLLSFIFSS